LEDHGANLDDGTAVMTKKTIDMFASLVDDERKEKCVRWNLVV